MIFMNQQTFFGKNLLEIRILPSYLISSSGPSRYLAPLALAISMPAKRKSRDKNNWTVDYRCIKPMVIVVSTLNL